VLGVLDGKGWKGEVVPFVCRYRRLDILGS
jgi:hypothetical protein